MRAILLVLALSVCLVGAVEFMLAPMLAPLADAFATTPEVAARLVSAYALAYAAAAPFAGRLADRIGRRRVLLPALLRPLLAKAGWLGAAVAGLLLSGEVLRARHGFGPAAAGGATALFALGLGLGNLAAGPVDRALGGPEAALLAALALLMAAVGGFLLWPGPPAVSLACLMLWGVALGVAAPASGSLLVRRAGAAVGTVLALGESLNNVALMLLMPLAAALLAEGGAAAAAPLLLGLQGAGMAVMALDRRWVVGPASLNARTGRPSAADRHRR